MKNNPELIETQAKAIVALAFRNGPIEDIHAGIKCPTCSDKSDYSRITQSEMKDIMKTAVNRVYTLLLLRDQKHDIFNYAVQVGSLYTNDWDDPELVNSL